MTIDQERACKNVFEVLVVVNFSYASDIVTRMRRYSADLAIQM
jgi:hypothetical protein